MTQEPAESSTVLAPAEQAWAGSAIFALVSGFLSILLLPLPPVGIILGMIGIAAAITARGEIRTTTKRGAGVSLAWPAVSVGSSGYWDKNSHEAPSSSS